MCGGLKWALHHTYPAIVVKELGIFISKCTPFLQSFYFFLHFIHSKWCGTYYSWHKCQVADPSPGPMLPWHHNLRYLPVGMCEVYVYINSVDDPATLCKDHWSHSKCGKRNVDLYVTKNTKGSNVAVDWSTHTVFEWRNNSAYFYPIWLICDTIFKINQQNFCGHNVSECWITELQQ